MTGRALIVGALKTFADEIPTFLCRNLHGIESELCQSRLKKFIAYTTEGGKLTRSLLTYEAYNALKPHASPAELDAVSRVAASVELLETFFLVIDDIEDNAETRRNRKCWWRLPGVGLSAINDALLMDNSIDWVVREAIPQHPKLDAMLRTIYVTRQSAYISQVLDCMKLQKLSDFNWNRYSLTVEGKSTYHSFYLPLALGYHMAEVSFDERKMLDIVHKMGLMFQAENDVVDCYPSASAPQRSSDLAEGKCTWVTLRTLEKLAADTRRRDAFLAHLVQGGEEHMQAAMATVHELDICGDYDGYRATSAKQIHAEMKEWRDLPTQMREMLGNIVDNRWIKVEGEKNKKNEKK